MSLLDPSQFSCCFRTIDEVVEDDPSLIKAVMSEENMIYMAVGTSLILVSLVILIVLIIYHKKSGIKAKLAATLIHRKSDRIDMKGRFRSLVDKAKTTWSEHAGIRFKTWNLSDTKSIREDVVQNVMLVANGILAIVFAVEWNSDNNPLLVIHHKFKNGFTISMDIFSTNSVADFASSLNFMTFLVNIINGTLSFAIVLAWCFTRTGERTSWIRVRLMSSASLLASIFVVIAALIFSTYFDNLVVLEKDKGYFITDNESMHDFASNVVKVSLNGLSLTVISFTIVFLFHGVGGGLFCGTVLFR